MRTRTNWISARGEPTVTLLLRHGQTPMSVQKRYSGRTDAALTDTGVRQAVAAAKRLVSAGIDAIVTSPLQRAARTAGEVAAASGVPVLADDGFRETDFGAWEGLTFAEVRERVAGGEIGRLEQLLITSRDPAPAPAAYIASSGGLFRDMTIHDFDMARFFLGEVAEVQAIGANLIEPYIAEAGDVDSAVVSMRGAGGELCQITNSRRCAFGYDQRVEAFGAEGMLSAGNQTATSVRRSGAAGTETAAPYLNFFLDRYAAAYRAELDHLVICIEQGLTPSPGFADGRAALVLADAATESMKTGQAVRVGS